ncbi:MAG: sulfatase-like hydrolase/transferase [Mariniblastus sp.]|nr:sulfatase-like hydrolase/transferase [Mariniblastus sp.]
MTNPLSSSPADCRPSVLSLRPASLIERGSGRGQAWFVYVSLLAGWCSLLAGLAVGDEKRGSNLPNIVVILTDDQGYADISLNPEHAREVSTPHMDALAREGVQFSQAYTSGHVCSPTRAGIMLGGYSQREGVYTAGDGGRGFDPAKKIFPAYLPDDYVSAAIGKWHLGLDTDYPELKWHAMNRGFDECYKFMGRGGHSYFNLRSDSEGKFNHPIYRNKDRINDQGYLTNRLTEEAVDFIDRNKSKPFFLYLAYNAVHAPAEAPAEDIEAVRKKFPGLAEDRVVLMAMLKHLDDGVGQVVAKLKQEDLFDNTLLFFLTDNGGSKAMGAVNTPLRGFKGSLDEGGIRTPLIVSWPDRFSGGRTVDQPVISFDILPTVLQATGERPPGEAFDGKSLLPLLTGQASDHHTALYWSKGPEDEWAVRQADWKLHQKQGVIELIDLGSDPGETENLVKQHPAKVRELQASYDQWIQQMPDPISGKPKRVDRADTPSPPGNARQQQRTERRAKRKAMRNEARTGGPTPAKKQLPAGNRKNVLLIVCDDLNTHVSPSGYEPIQTPTLAQLAQDSMTFSHAYCQYPVCGPSRASFLHGLYPQSTGVLDNRLDIRQTRPGSTSLPQLFKQNGYWTASVGKVFHSPRHEPGELAWSEFQRFDNEELPRVAAARKAFEAKHGSIEARENRQAWKAYLPTQVGPLIGQTPPGFGPSGLQDAQHKDGKNVRQVISWLDEESYGDQPFFIACGIQKPHVPFLAPQKYFDRYPLDSLVYQADRPDLWESLPSSAMSRRYSGFGFELGVENDARRRQYMQAYHACVSFVDAQIGLLLASLKEKGLWEDTIVVFTSDHGFHLGDHFMWGKVTLFDIGTRVPFMVHVPGMTEAGSRSQAMVELVDIYPTLAELTGLATPAEVQGSSLVPLLKSPQRPGQKRHAYSVVRRGNQLGYALRNQRWRYGQWPDGEELYNLTRDPAEKNNLANNPKQKERLEQFRILLKEKQLAARSQAVAGEVPAGGEGAR